MTYAVDFDKLEKGDIVVIYDRGNYLAVTVKHINKIFKTIDCEVEGYVSFYNVSWLDVNPFFARTYKTTYLKEVKDNA